VSHAAQQARCAAKRRAAVGMWQPPVCHLTATSTSIAKCKMPSGKPCNPSRKTNRLAPAGSICDLTRAPRGCKLPAAARERIEPISREKRRKIFLRFLVRWPKNSHPVRSRFAKSSLAWRENAKSFEKTAPPFGLTYPKRKETFSRTTPHNADPTTPSSFAATRRPLLRYRHE
jgi:hypothetical protein